MNEADYAITKSDKLNRLLSLLILILDLSLEISDGLFIQHRILAPLLATAMIWFPDTLGAALPWRAASRDIRFFGWFVLILISVIALT
jgi:hypothetical protein